MSVYHLPIINRSEIPYIYIYIHKSIGQGQRGSGGREVYPIQRIIIMSHSITKEQNQTLRYNTQALATTFCKTTVTVIQTSMGTRINNLLFKLIRSDIPYFIQKFGTFWHSTADAKMTSSLVLSVRSPSCTPIHSPVLPSGHINSFNVKWLCCLTNSIYICIFE